MAAFGVNSPAADGVALALGPILSVFGTAASAGRLLRPGPLATWSEVRAAVGLLLAGYLLANVVINAGPVPVVLLAGPDQQVAAGIFTSVLVLARLLLFASAAVQAALLPPLARLAADHDTAGFRRRLASILGGVLGLGLLAG